MRLLVVIPGVFTGALGSLSNVFERLSPGTSLSHRFLFHGVKEKGSYCNGTRAQSPAVSQILMVRCGSVQKCLARVLAQSTSTPPPQKATLCISPSEDNALSPSCQLTCLFLYIPREAHVFWLCPFPAFRDLISTFRNHEYVIYVTCLASESRRQASRAPH
jgi:hypothetical protein